MRLLKLLSCLLLAPALALALAVTGAALCLGPSLPSVESLRNVRMQVPLRIYSADGELIAEFGEMRRSPLPLAEIPQQYVDALLSADDDSFREHSGVDLKSLMRAASQLLRSGHIQSGGSTITMQVAKNFFLSNERKFTRKINEILLALQIERTLTKDEILSLYVNKIYLGNRAYGVEAAAQVYYGKSIRDLSLGQLAMIAGLPKAPSRYNPIANPKRAQERRDWILGRMFELGKISKPQLEAALAEPVDANAQVNVAPQLEAPYVAEMVRAEMVSRYGNDAYTEGFRVHTSVRSDLQRAANSALREGMLEYDQRHGYRGAEANIADPANWAARLATQKTLGGLEPAIVSEIASDSIQVLTPSGPGKVMWQSMRWARSTQGRTPARPADVVKTGDLIRVQRQGDGSLRFAQLPAAQSALVSLRPADGAIMALVGGFSFEQSSYNRAVQARRQPGSSFKPFVYSAAIDKGFSPASVFDDAPLEFTDPWSGEVWRPQNDDGSFDGPLRMREALFRSRNLVSIRILQAIGVDYALDYTGNFSLPRNELPTNFSLALGTANLTPMEIARGYTVFANGGYRVHEWLIERIESRDGKLLFSVKPATVPAGQTASNKPAPAADGSTVQAERVLDPRTTYIMTSMLRDVIRQGTARKALSLKRNDLAGKTGTTNDQKDSWFSGYNGDFVTTVWAGFDQPQSLGRTEYGGTVALPIWIRYMDVALDKLPEHMQPEPPGLLNLRIDPETGLAASSGTPGAFFELFKKEFPPQQAVATPEGAGFTQDNFGGAPTPVPYDLF